MPFPIEKYFQNQKSQPYLGRSPYLCPQSSRSPKKSKKVPMEIENYFQI
jgi:hypothetical protein